MANGFSVDLDEAEKACHAQTGSLPNAATILRQPIADVRSYEGWEDGTRSSDMDWVYRMQGAYADFCEEIAQRQIRACDTMDDTAEALREIIAVYRRVDGQY